MVSAILSCECILFGNKLRDAARRIGLASPLPAGVVAAGVCSFILLLLFPVYALQTGASLTLLPNWYLLLPGLFAQAGIAEETLFRGYLFGHLRAGRPFWRAAFLSMLPFVAVHLFMFQTMPFPIALAAVGLAVVTSFPFAHLYELGGNTIWAPALLHFVVQGAIKVVVVGDAQDTMFPLVWMAGSAVVPWLVFARSSFRSC